MRADEEPHDRFTLTLADRAVIVRDSHGPDIWMWGQFLELQTWMGWIVLEEAVGTARLLLDPLGEAREITVEPSVDMGRHSISGSNSEVRPARKSSRASSASLRSLSA